MEVRPDTAPRFVQWCKGLLCVKRLSSYSIVLRSHDAIACAHPDNNPNTRSVPYFAGIMAIWSVLFLEHWKRTEKNTAMKWGTIGFEQTEVERPQFVGETIRSPVDGKPMLYYPREKRARQELVSSAVIYAFIGVVVAVIASIFALRIAINSTGAAVAGVELAGVIASVLLAIQIQVGFSSTIFVLMSDSTACLYQFLCVVQRRSCVRTSCSVDTPRHS